jgi:hypothetical protein
MATLQTQYKNYIQENPASSLTYDEWLNKKSWEIYISDDFQIGPDGAFEYNDKGNFKIEERELTYIERYKYWFLHNFETGMEYCEEIVPNFNNDYYEPTPTKIITITHNDGSSIETYE